MTRTQQIGLVILLAAFAVYVLLRIRYAFAMHNSRLNAFNTKNRLLGVRGVLGVERLLV